MLGGGGGERSAVETILDWARQSTFCISSSAARYEKQGKIRQRGCSGAEVMPQGLRVFAVLSEKPSLDPASISVSSQLCGVPASGDLRSSSGLSGHLHTLIQTYRQIKNKS